jgi:hypothetical protein
MGDILAEETTTLPEGAQLSVYRVMRAKLGPCTRMVAIHPEKQNVKVEMLVDDIAAYNLRWYLERMKKEIERHRANLTTKPGLIHPTPHDVKGFTHNMAYHGMFILQPWADENKPEALKGSINGTKEIKAPKKRVAKSKTGK